MRNIKLTIEYDGTNYCGWQVQSRNRRKKSIQETIEKALGKILQQKVKLIASGRTDAGVHALAQVANFKTTSGIPTENLQKALNAFLPDDIAINAIGEVPLNFHSRFAACSKVYRYTILNRKSPSVFLRNRAYFFPYFLDIRLMRQEARCLLGRHNFKSFKAQDKKERASIRTIERLRITKDKDLVYIDIEANGFLYNMVRNIVGTLIEIGRVRFPKDSLNKILLLRNRKFAGPTAPACGLCLIKVKY